jgi:hypothetical protein
LSKAKFLLGFDGFVDTFIEVVLKRIDAEKYLKMKTMKSWADRIYESSGSSANLERIIKKQTAGGITGNVGKALIELVDSFYGLNSKIKYPSPEINCIGTYGTHENPESINDVFIKNMKIKDVKNVKPINLNSFDEPGATDAYEFADGKIMMSFFEPMNRMSWQKIVDHFGMDWISNMFEDSNIICMGYWSVIPEFGDIIKCLTENIFNKFNMENDKKEIFFDFGDIRKKTKENLFELVQILKKTNEYGDISISFNHTEAFNFLIAHNIEFSIDSIESIPKIINDIIPVKRIIIHSPKIAALYTNENTISIQQAYTSNPKFSTSAGDHFNAGFLFGTACGLNETECLCLANLNSAAYIRLGKSPKLENILYLTKNYEKYLVNDIDYL